MKGFTVIIPTYNSSSYIENSLNSVEMFSKNRECEVIVVDDASSDIEKLKEICSKYSFVRLIEKVEKTNASHSRNIGILQSHHDLIFLLDSDDMFLENCLDKRIRLHNENKTGVIFGNYITSLNGKEVLSTMSWAGEDVRDFIFCKNGDFRTSTISIFKPFYKNTLFDDKAGKHQDWIFGIRCCDNYEALFFDHTPISIINVGYVGRMSSKLNIGYSKYLLENYVFDIAHINGFSKKHWRTAIANKDSQAVGYFASIFKPVKLTDYFSRATFLLLGKRYVISLASRFLVMARRIKWSL